MSKDQKFTGASGAVLSIEVLFLLCCLCLFCTYELLRLMSCLSFSTIKRIQEKYLGGVKKDNGDAEEFPYDQELQKGEETEENEIENSNIIDVTEEIIHIEEKSEYNGSGYSFGRTNPPVLSGDERDDDDEEEESKEDPITEEERLKKFRNRRNDGYGMSTVMFLEDYPKTSTFVTFLFRLFAFLFNLCWLVYVYFSYQTDNELMFLASSERLGILSFALLTFYYFASMNYSLVLLIIQVSSLWEYDPRKPFCWIGFFEYWIRLIFQLTFVSSQFVTVTFWLIVVPHEASVDNFRISPSTIPLHGLNAVFTIIEIVALFRVTFPLCLCCFSSSYAFLYLFIVTILVKTKTIEEYPYCGLISVDRNGYSVFLRLLMGFCFCFMHFGVSLLLIVRFIGIFCCEKCRREEEFRKKKEKQKKSEEDSSLNYLNQRGSHLPEHKYYAGTAKKSKKKKKDDTTLGVPDGYKLMSSLNDESHNNNEDNVINKVAGKSGTSGPWILGSNNAGLISVNFQKLKNRDDDDDDDVEEDENVREDDEEEEEEYDYEEEEELNSDNTNKNIFDDEDEDGDEENEEVRRNSSSGDHGDEEFETPDSD